jgi:hypothetical protein
MPFSDRITTISTPTLTGQASTGEQIQLFDEAGQQVGQAIARCHLNRSTPP